MITDEANRLLNDLVFIDDRERLIGEIESVKRSVFSVSTPKELETSLKKSLPISRAKEFFNHLSENKKSIYDGHIIEEILELLRKKVEKLDTTIVYLAIDLDTAELTKIQKKITELLGKQVLLRVETVPELLGGLKIEYRGVYLDLSLATTVKKMISQA